MNLATRAATLLLAATWLSGCVSFEVAPVVAMECDRSLAGRWLFPENENETPGHVRPEAAVAEDCTFVSTSRDGTSRKGVFKTFEFEGHRYLSVDVGKTETITDTEDTLVETWPATRVMLARYRRESDTLWVWVPDPSTLTLLKSSRVTVHSDATIDAKTRQPEPAGFSTDFYISGKREDIARFLADNGDVLYSGMSTDRALPLTRAPRKMRP